MASNADEKLIKLKALKEFGGRVNNDFATKEALKTVSDKVDNIEKTGGEQNKIEKIKVNGSEQNISDADKSVDIKVPTNLSELSNDKEYQTASDVTGTVNNAINEFATNVSNDEVVNTFKELVDYAAEHGEEAATMAGGIAKNKSDIEALQGNIASKVDKDGVKQLSTEDYTTAEKNKLANMEIASDEEVTTVLDEVFSAAKL